MRILANDGIDTAGKKLLEEAGFEVDTNHIPQDELAEKLNAYDAVTVRSATKLRQELIDQCPNIKAIGRGGVGMDNIDVAYARSKGIAVINTPAASSLSVAELVFAHLLNGVRFLYDSNRKMPVEGDTNFAGLKKAYAKGVELRGKTLGVVGFGRIGRETAKVALGLGMDVIYTDLFDGPTTLSVSFSGGIEVTLPVQQVSFQELLQAADFISLHVPFLDKPAIGKEEFALLKDGVGLVNASRGGVIDELALIEALDSGKVAFAALDVFDNEPTPRKELLAHPRISLTPHIGAATNEAQERIGIELAQLLIDSLKK
ncbi:D-2-hydroxyacid dehydrogenase [Sphingobacterium griseoflavum]|uniref:3-phosphoglycerate dehydrogenase n=1 Tax=Sphingobacterium griseoflavum TaxID=1474952 RepID=A0ABQ3HWE6_9SPHI|nr:D-2-hydroxyacid dehydrogenase [Sphingobacterium griseoflavum]GHE34512.1 3-phosphoglycerate dehydrogenase [Sphingobacterium griseoflavum]